MAEKNQSFLEILNSYFSNLSDTQVVAGSKEKITIPMEWIFSEKIDRALIEKAFINLICKANKSYRGKLKEDRQFYGKISSLEIERSDSGVNLVIKSRDGWTKILVTADKNLRGPFYAISEDRLYEEILTVYNLKGVGQVCKEFNLSMEERERFIAQLRNPETSQQRKRLVASQMTLAAENLTKYYDYMSKKKTKYEALSGVIQQRKGRGQRGAIKGGIRQPRRSEIYDFKEREEILQDMNPNCIINVDKIEDDNTVSRFSHIIYVYKNPREKQGYLFVAEPFEGMHNTRMKFVPKEEYDSFKVKEGENKLVRITEKFMEMSDEEFGECKFSKKFKHTSIDRYRSKLRRIILGAPMTDRSTEAQCKEADRVLFNGEKRRTREYIKKLVSGVPISAVNSARGWMYGRPIEERGWVQISQ